MNEQRSQAYLNLINQLLSCNNGDEPRILGENQELLDRVLIEMRTFDAFPQEWANTQNNLGNAYLDRIREDKAENLETAITCYQEALKVYTFDDFSQNWATTQNNIGNAYLYRIRGDRAKNLEKAIAAYTEALKVRTFNDFSQYWAETQNNLGNAYFDRIRSDKTENLERAIKSYQNAFKIRTKEADPPQLPTNCPQFS